MNSQLRYFIFLWCFAPLFLNAQQMTSIQLLTDLKKQVDISQQNKLPLLLFFSMEDCPYCERVRENIIVPMIISGDYKNKVIIREINIDDPEKVLVSGFHGMEKNKNTVVEYYNIDFVPALLLVGATGKELVKRMVGITTDDYYGYKLDQKIDSALGSLYFK
jgi:thioredoxin-related protein